jgi:hypothetical protein
MGAAIDRFVVTVRKKSLSKRNSVAANDDE